MAAAADLSGLNKGSYSWGIGSQDEGWERSGEQLGEQGGEAVAGVGVRARSTAHQARAPSPDSQVANPSSVGAGAPGHRRRRTRRATGRCGGRGVWVISAQATSRVRTTDAPTSSRAGDVGGRASVGRQVPPNPGAAASGPRSTNSLRGCPSSLGSSRRPRTSTASIPRRCRPGSPRAPRGGEHRRAVEDRLSHPGVGPDVVRRAVASTRASPTSVHRRQEPRPARRRSLSRRSKRGRRLRVPARRRRCRRPRPRG